ncbi:hypothetical protein [Jeotgalibacillus soli]|uniref:Uncharacterized protein n=1 Tax=Jeotgalibacillus soli TaxID=889306 RepID=A0A0C2S603_9BACL|nr:hypothetical protein [Jeotgalibacillus soli]KIL49469.1 hypothetical protein KP78_09370 [Jeotgalibacillus soli]
MELVLLVMLILVLTAFVYMFILLLVWFAAAHEVRCKGFFLLLCYWLS